jgi:hypothetical protein
MLALKKSLLSELRTDLTINHHPQELDLYGDVMEFWNKFQTIRTTTCQTCNLSSEVKELFGEVILNFLEHYHNDSKKKNTIQELLDHYHSESNIPD